MIEAGLVNSAKLEFLRGVHQPTDKYKIALYSDKAKLNSATTRYSAAGEVDGSGYYAGGAELKGCQTGLLGEVAFMTFDPVEFQNSSIAARGALIYNATRGNAAVVVVDFGEVKKSSVGLFRVEFPNPSKGGAIIWLA